MSPELALGSDEQYLQSWSQFNAAYRANVAAACRSAAAAAPSEAAAAAPALECFQQYLFAIEDLATWAEAIPKWRSGTPLVEAIEVANARWDVVAELQDASVDFLVGCFSLPPLDDFVEPVRGVYRGRLEAWTALARDVGRFAAEEAQNGGQLANRLQNKMKHGLHFAVAGRGEAIRVHFYPHHASAGEPRLLPRLAPTPAAAERWLRRTYDLCRLTSAILTTLFVATSASHRDPVYAWVARTEPNRELSVREIEEDLQALRVPAVKWVDEPGSLSTS